MACNCRVHTSMNVSGKPHFQVDIKLPGDRCTPMFSAGTTDIRNMLPQEDSSAISCNSVEFCSGDRYMVSPSSIHIVGAPELNAVFLKICRRAEHPSSPPAGGLKYDWRCCMSHTPYACVRSMLSMSPEPSLWGKLFDAHALVWMLKGVESGGRHGNLHCHFLCSECTKMHTCGLHSGACALQHFVLHTA